jgi:diaminopimelate epimerase
LKTLETVHEEVGKWTIRVNMGEPILDPEEIPFEAGNFPSPIRAFPLRTEEGLQQVTVTSMGNPHCTIFVSDFDALDWPGVGQEIEDHELFPNRTNVEFVRVVSRNEVEVRFWERGVGHTMSSGTGSCAAVVASILNGLTNREVHVQTEAGSLEVTWPEGREVCLTGPVEKIAQGTYYYQE